MAKRYIPAILLLVVWAVSGSAVRAATVSFGGDRVVGEEGGAAVSLAVTLSSAANATVNVAIAGTALPEGADFTCATTTLVFSAAGATTSNLVFSIVDDALAEGPETAKLRLGPISGVTLGATTQAVLVVRDNDALAILSANLTSGTNLTNDCTTYDDPGGRILEALQPDIVLIQEWVLKSGVTYRAFVDEYFGTNYSYYVEPETDAYPMPNGIISRWAITNSGQWADSNLTGRDFAWARIDLPGLRNLNAVSIHIKATDLDNPAGQDAATRRDEAEALTNYIAQAGWSTNDYLVIGGDLNLTNRTEMTLRVLTNVVSDAHQSADQNGDKETNSGRDRPYDFVLPNGLLNARHTNFTCYGHTFTNGMVFDTRLTWSSGVPPPARATDSSAANMQHMAVLKVFEFDNLLNPPQSFAATPASQTRIDLSFTTNAAGNSVIVAWNSDGNFGTPSGAAPAVGASFAGGTVVYKGGVSPQSHTGLTACATTYYKCWSYSGTNYSTGLVADATTAGPGAPASIWASATNTTDFAAAWSAASGATSYQLDVSTNSNFQTSGGAGGGSIYLVDFEDDSKSSYAAGDVTLGGISWNFNEAVIGSTDGSDRFNGSKSARVRSNETVNAGSLMMNADTNMGLSSITLAYAKFGSDANAAGRVDYSTNSGASWISAGTFDVTSTNLTPFESTNLNVFGDVRIRVVKTTGTTTRFNIDDIRLYPYGGASAPSFVAGYSNRTVSGTSQSVTGLTSGAIYYFRVRAVAGTCTSDSSSTAPVTTTASAPSNQTISFSAIGAQLTTNVVTLSATASSGLAVTFAVGSGSASISNGNVLTFSGTGTVRIVASQAGNGSWNPAPNVTNSFTVSKATASVTLNGLAQTYDGTARTVTATTVPGSLSVGITYNGSGTVPTAAGSYAVTGTVNSAMYQGSKTGTLVVAKAAAGVTLSGLARIYDGTPKSATATTAPAGLTVGMTYNGSGSAPSAIGSYTVVAAVAEANYAGGATGTLSIASVTNVFNTWLANEQGQSTNDPNYAPGADVDKDGATTWEEFLADTDPSLSNSVLVLTGQYTMVSASNLTGSLRLQFPASTSRYYQLEYCTDLINQNGGATNLGWGVPGMAITNNTTGTWYGVIRARLQAP